jgi:hypothetical protein
VLGRQHEPLHSGELPRNNAARAGWVSCASAEKPPNMALHLTIADGRALRALPLALAAECQYVSGTESRFHQLLDPLVRESQELSGVTERQPSTS